MQSLTVSELQRNIGEAQDIADREPLFITRNGREKYVLLSIDEYHRLKRRDREVLGVEELSEEDVRAIALAEVPAEYAYLDELLKEEGTEENGVMKEGVKEGVKERVKKAEKNAKKK